MNWDAITSISTALLTLFTLGLMVATFWLAITAYQAKNTWKSELKERKKLDLLREAKLLLEKIQTHLYFVETSTNLQYNDIEQVDEYLSEHKDTLSKLLNIQQELIYIKCEVFSNILMAIIAKGNTSPIFKALLNKPIIPPISTQERIQEEVKILLANTTEIKDLIHKSVMICDEEIQKFYNN